ncbi:MAG TPA: hypothetical protein VF609_10025 [Flavisolibacter sp.]
MRVRKYFRMFILMTGLSLPAISYGQTDPPTEPVDVPIDGGLSLLLAAGIGYGVKKGYANHKKKMNANKEKNVVDK